MNGYAWWSIVTLMHYSTQVRPPSADGPDIRTVNTRTNNVMYDIEIQWLKYRNSSQVEHKRVESDECIANHTFGSGPQQRTKHCERHGDREANVWCPPP